MNYLALGDSYTYGEQVCILDNFPYQITKMLRDKGYQMQAPEIIAKTAWTSAELIQGIKSFPTLIGYNFCTLLIGVNNQYRGLSIDSYRDDLHWLTEFGLSKLEQSTGRLILINIPDWGMTPYNTDRDRQSVSSQIDEYNQVILEKSQELNCHYVDVCTMTREHAQDPSYLADDKLHYSAKEYKLWAEKILTECLNLS